MLIDLKQIVLLFMAIMSVATSHAQNVLDAVDVKENIGPPDNIYADISYPSYFYYSNCFNQDTSRELTDKDYQTEGEFVVFDRSSFHQKNSVLNAYYKAKYDKYRANLEYYKQYFSKPPIEFKECSYFNPSIAAREEIEMMVKEGVHRIDKMPEALRFYSAPQDSNITVASLKKQLAAYFNCKYSSSGGSPLDLHLTLKKPLYEIFRPFYFQRTTVTNKEYREFINWVRDSIVRVMLYNAGWNDMALDGHDIDPPPLNWKTKINYADTNVQKAIESLYLPQQERFYRRKSWDTKRFNYVYYKLNEERKFEKITINVYPDTLDWIYDFPEDFMETMTDMYFWHSAYDDFPVVGISQKQALAYLNWKTEQEQKKLDAEGSPWIVKYELPTEYEWEMVATAGRQKNGQPLVYPYHFYIDNDKSYITDLLLRGIPYNKLLSQTEKNLLGLDTIRNSLYGHGLFYDMPQHERHFFSIKYKIGKRTEEMSYYTLKSDFKKNEKQFRQNPLLASQYDCNGISFLGCNVSEWLQETYKDNWEQIYDYQHTILECIGGKSAKHLLAQEDYSNSRNDTNGVLVRGANWYDQRYGSIGGKNTEGINAKVFVSPDSDYATVGFRYVIILQRKDEREIINQLQTYIKDSGIKQ